MGFPGPGTFLVPSPTGLVRKLMRRATAAPARREYQKVSAALPVRARLVLLSLSGQAMPRAFKYSKATIEVEKSHAIPFPNAPLTLLSQALSQWESCVAPGELFLCLLTLRKVCFDWLYPCLSLIIVLPYQVRTTIVSQGHGPSLSDCFAVVVCTRDAVGGCWVAAVVSVRAS